MDTIGPATSEWVVDGADRYAATPEDALPALDVPGFRAHDPVVDAQLEKSACTQVLVHKARDGSYRLLLDGCESQPDADGYHTLPDYRTRPLLSEDATGREVPAPVMVSVLAEDGTHTQGSTMLQVKQRTFVNGTQIDEGTEAVIAEGNLRPTCTRDVRCLSRIVPYPMAIGPAVKIVFVDRYKRRELSLKKNKKAMEAVLAALQGRGLSPQQAKAVIEQAEKMEGFSRAAALGSAAFAIATVGPFILAALLQAVQIGALTLVKVGVAAGAWRTFVAAREIAQYWWLYRQSKQLEAQEKERTKPKESIVSIFDLPMVIRRLTGTTTGGIYSRKGAPLTEGELRKLKRMEDVVVMDWVINHSELDSSVRAEMVSKLEENYKESLPAGHPEKTNLTDDTKAKIQKEADEILSGVKTDGDTFEIESVQASDLLGRGYVESVLCIEVVDARRPGDRTRETFRLRSPSPLGAGIVAAGYLQLERKLQETMAIVRRAFAETLDPNYMPLVHQYLYKRGKVTGVLKKDLMQWWVQRRQAVQFPPEQSILAALEQLAKSALDALQALNSLATPLPGAVAIRRPPAVARYLPHVVRMKSIGSGSFALGNEDGDVFIAQDGGIVGVSNDGLRDAIGDMRTALRTVNQAMQQFVEGEGVARPRMRVELVMAGSSLDPARRGIVPIRLAPKRTGNIDTRHVYAPRMPLQVADSMAFRNENAHLREQLSIAWLREPLREQPGSGMAELFRVPVSHVGELTLGVIADLATDDLVARVPEGLHVSPERGQLMASSVMRAIQRLRAVVPLARQVFRERPTPTRLDDNDALFLCYPEGRTLLKLLRESAAWRKWAEPQSGTWASRRTGWRQDMRAAMAEAAPAGIAALSDLLESIERLQDATVPLDRFPFLPTQTLALQTPEAFPTLDRAWSGLAAQLEHAAYAAQRLDIMAKGLDLSEAHRAALLRDSARARPVLACMPTGSVLAAAPASCVDSMALFTQPIALRLGPLQPGVPSAPSAHTLVDSMRNLGVLQARVAAMRMDIVDLAKERALIDRDASLAGVFAKLNVNGSPAQYLVPFGDAAVKGDCRLMGTFFESTPVYMGLLTTDAPKAALYAELRGAIVPRRAQDHVDNLHPFVITTNGEALPGLRLGVALVNMEHSAVAKAAAPETLKDAIRMASENAGGVSVDAANAILFNVERLVQCALLAVATCPECRSLVVPPPDKANRKRVPVPEALEAREGLLLIEMRRNAVLVLMSDVQGFQEADMKREMGYDDSAVKEDKAEALLANVEYTGALYRWLQRATDVILASVQANDFVSAYNDALKADDAEGKAKVALYMYFGDVWHDAWNRFTNRRKERVQVQEVAQAVNRRAEEDEFVAHCWEEGAWQSVVAVANAVARSLVTEPPTLMATTRSLVCSANPEPNHGLWIAVAAWRSQGLAAVPLCELASVLACV